MLVLGDTIIGFILNFNCQSILRKIATVYLKSEILEKGFIRVVQVCERDPMGDRFEHFNGNITAYYGVLGAIDIALDKGDVSLGGRLTEI